MNPIPIPLGGMEASIMPRAEIIMPAGNQSEFKFFPPRAVREELLLVHTALNNL